LDDAHGNSGAKALLWLIGLVSFFGGCGYMMAESFAVIDPALELSGVVPGVSMCFIGCTLVARVRLLRTTLTDSHSCLSGLMRAEVTPEAAEIVAALIKDGRREVAVGSVLYWGCFSLLAVVLAKERGGLTTLEMIALSLVYLFAPVALTARIGAGFIHEVARVVIVDRLRVLADRVRRSTSDTLDFKGLLTEIVDAHRLISEMSAEMDWMIKLQLAYFAALGYAFGFTGCDFSFIFLNFPSILLMICSIFRSIFSLVRSGSVHSPRRPSTRGTCGGLGRSRAY
jgi:hypothetical protein